MTHKSPSESDIEPKWHKPYPLLLEPKLLPKVWGGSRLAALFDQPREEPIGEAWIASTHPYATNRVVNGPFASRSLTEVLEAWGVPEAAQFPLLIKLLESREALSVQVHPNDALAKALEDQPRGKSEAWLILEGLDESHVGLGFAQEPPVRDLAALLETGAIVECIRKLRVAPGNWLLVPSGEIHYIGANLLLLEVQQSSDLTYRIYDWGRSSRELHISKANQALRWTARGDLEMFFPGPETPPFQEDWPFRIESMALETGPHTLLAREGFSMLVPLSGSGELRYTFGTEGIRPFHCWLVPPGENLELNVFEALRLLICSPR